MDTQAFTQDMVQRAEEMMRELATLRDSDPQKYIAFVKEFSAQIADLKKEVDEMAQ